MYGIKVVINDEEYTEEQFKRDITRMFDKYRYADSEHMGEDGCKDVVCENCPLDGCCGARRHNMFERIRIVYNWAKVYPTNKDMLEKTFGEDALIKSPLYEEWLKQEYKGPNKGEKKNG